MIIDDIEFRDNEINPTREQMATYIHSLHEEIKVLEKALKLACVPRDDWNCKEPKRIKYTSNYDYFIEQAKESLK